MKIPHIMRGFTKKAIELSEYHGRRVLLLVADMGVGSSLVLPDSQLHRQAQYSANGHIARPGATQGPFKEFRV